MARRHVFELRCVGPTCDQGLQADWLFRVRIACWLGQFGVEADWQHEVAKNAGKWERFEGSNN